MFICWHLFAAAKVLRIVDFYPLFRVVDLAAGVDFVYEGPYTLKVIAITDSPLNEPQWFTEEEIIRYNNMN